jgi:hypothetical protein
MTLKPQKLTFDSTESTLHQQSRKGVFINQNIDCCGFRITVQYRD